LSALSIVATLAERGCRRAPAIPNFFEASAVFQPQFRRSRAPHSRAREVWASDYWKQNVHRALDWIGFDPTNRAVGGFNPIPVRVARDIGQIMSVVGRFAGATDRLLSVEAGVSASGRFTALPRRVGRSASYHMATGTARHHGSAMPDEKPVTDRDRIEPDPREVDNPPTVVETLEGAKVRAC
jgi:hypothetical protein